MGALGQGSWCVNNCVRAHPFAIVHPIEDLDEIYSFADGIHDAVQRCKD